MWGTALLLWYQASHFSINVSNQQLSDAQIAIEGALGQAIFSPSKAMKVLPGQTAAGSGNLNSVLSPESGASEGLIDAYRKDPEKYKRYAEMLDTALRAKRVGEFALSLAPSEIPRSSSELKMDPHKKVDSWGDLFCILPLEGRVAVVSGGPSKVSCSSLPLSVAQLNRSERTVYEGPSGSIIVIVSKKPYERSGARTPNG